MTEEFLDCFPSSVATKCGTDISQKPYTMFCTINAGSGRNIDVQSMGVHFETGSSTSHLVAVG